MLWWYGIQYIIHNGLSRCSIVCFGFLTCITDWLPWLLDLVLEQKQPFWAEDPNFRYQDILPCELMMFLPWSPTLISAHTACRTMKGSLGTYMQDVITSSGSLQDWHRRPDNWRNGKFTSSMQNFSCVLINHWAEKKKKKQPALLQPLKQPCMLWVVMAAVEGMLTLSPTNF